MKDIIEKIKSKFGMSTNLVVYMDGSGHLEVGIFDPESDEDFTYVRFDSLHELEEILNR